MKLPRSVLVGSMRYAIQDMSEDMHELTATSDGTSAVGLCDKTQLIIYVYPKQATPKLWSTLWHEIRHASIEESAINLKDDEEEVVSHMERIDCMIFRDNPILMKNLIKVLSGQDDNRT